MSGQQTPCIAQVSFAAPCPPPSHSVLIRRALDFVFGRHRGQRGCSSRRHERERNQGRRARATSGARMQPHRHAPPHVTSSSSQATFGTIPSNGSRIRMPSPVASLMSLSGTEGAVKKLLDGGAPLAARDFFFLLPLSGPAPSSRVAAAKRVGGGFDKSECARLLSVDCDATAEPCLQRATRQAAAGLLFLLPASKARWAVTPRAN